jgi:hypothetical protein
MVYGYYKVPSLPVTSVTPISGTVSTSGIFSGTTFSTPSWTVVRFRLVVLPILIHVLPLVVAWVRAWWQVSIVVIGIVSRTGIGFSVGGFVVWFSIFGFPFIGASIFPLRGKFN